ncbi:MAG TPA: hypothetical protein PKE21_14525 [Flavobacteriales bacterium]|nr:hypothetical protein [Flavobacteriales bacterium]HMR28695.1 hypothetical protein [Flavobacteriales bacterium]
MKSASRVLLVIALGLCLPWKSIDFCVAHPFGEPHHEGLSTCEKRALWKGGAAVWPPMHCQEFSMNTDDYVGMDPVTVGRPQSELTVPLPLLLIAVETTEEQTFIDPPVPRCRSAPTVSAHSLRGPPFLA